MRVLLDFDSTLFPLLDSMARLPGGERISYDDMPTWEALVDRSGGVEVMLALFDGAMAYDRMCDVGLFPGAALAVRALHSDGFRFTVATDRPSPRVEDALRFLRDHEVPVDAVEKVRADDKAGYCHTHGIRVIVDDHPRTIEQAARSGLYPLALAFQYNADARRAHGVPTITDWALMEGAIRSAGGSAA